MTTNNRYNAYRFGLKAEKIAAWYLRCKGYRIVAERHRNLQGEIDLLALRGNTLAVIEVKARKTMAACSEAVTPFKQQKIARAVQGVLTGSSKITGLGDAASRNIRFDVVCIVPWQWPHHIKDAWRM
jgi:putative endonuclease